jgi:DNA end-binding protein Ku
VPRPIWSGSISFGLVNIPVKVFPAIESHRPALHEVERETGRRIRYKRVAEGSDREVPWQDIARGVEVSRGQLVSLSREELEAAEPDRTRSIEVEQFVDLGEIDPVSWDQSYYLAPDGAQAGRAYALLREALRRSGRVAIGRFVMRSKEHLLCLRALPDVVVLHTMFFADEVRRTADLPDVPAGSGRGRGPELDLALQIIDSLTGKWNPRRYQDTFRARVEKLVQEKAEGGQIRAAPGPARGGEVIDLMDALKASLAAGGKKPAATRAAAAPRRRGRAASRGKARTTRPHRAG